REEAAAGAPIPDVDIGPVDVQPGDFTPSAESPIGRGIKGMDAHGWKIGVPAPSTRRAGDPFAAGRRQRQPSGVFTGRYKTHAMRIPAATSAILPDHDIRWGRTDPAGRCRSRRPLAEVGSLFGGAGLGNGPGG